MRRYLEREAHQHSTHDPASTWIGGHRAKLLTNTQHVPPMPRNRGLLGIGWSEWLSLLTVAGILLYGAVAFAYSNFYAALGVTPDEVGIGHAEMIRRAGLNASVLVALVAVASAFASMGGAPSRDHRSAVYAVGAGFMMLASFGIVVLLAILGVSASTAVPYGQMVLSAAILFGLRALVGPTVLRQRPWVPRALMAALRASPSDPEARRRRRGVWLRLLFSFVIGVSVFSLAFVQVIRQQGLGLLLWSIVVCPVVLGLALIDERRARRMRATFLPLPAPLVVTFLGVATYTVFLIAGAIGLNAAARLEAFEDPIDRGSLDPVFLDVQASRVCMLWLSVPMPPSLDHELFYLGQAGGVTVLFDSSTRSALRIPSGNLATYGLSTDRGRAGAASPRPCPVPSVGRGP